MNKKITIKTEELYNQQSKIILKEIYEVAKRINIKRVLIVGGAVRDVIIKMLNDNININTKDLDLLIEGSAIELAEEIESHLGINRVTKKNVFESFNTAEMTIDQITIDIAGAREETYHQPGDNPKVINSTIEKDLRRRDFNINALAIDIASSRLYDLYKGQESILKKELKLLHDKSIKEDPTRIIRAARYAARFNFKLERSSIDQVKNTLKEWPWDWVKGASSQSAPAAFSTRLKLEISILLEEENWELAIKNLKDWNGFNLLDESIQNNKNIIKRIQSCSHLGLKPLTVLISLSDNPLDLANRLQISNQQKSVINKVIDCKKWINEISTNNQYKKWDASKWTQEIEIKNWGEEVVALAINLEIDHWQLLYEWWSIWRHIKSPISAKKLIKEGWEPGIRLGAELKRLRNIRINETVNKLPSNMK